MIAATIGAPGIAAGESGTASWSREAAVEIAREGNFDEALRRLGELRDAAPADPRLLHDETVVLTWAGRDRLAFGNAASLSVETTPDYVAKAVARSARNLGEFEAATRWYTALLDRDMADLDARRGLAMTAADAGDFTAAWGVLDAAAPAERNDVTLLLTEAYILERERRYLEALASYQRITEVAPDNKPALRGTALMLRAVLMPRQALALANRHPGILSDEETVNLEADVAALQIRYGSQSWYPDARRHEGTDTALAKVDELLARPDLDADMALRLRYDRIVALANRRRATEAITEFENLGVDHAVIPSYALAAAGMAYLSERQADTARRLLEQAVARDPGNFQLKFQLFFAYTDSREAKRAIDLAGELLATLPETNRVPGSKVVKGNRDYLRAAIMFGLAQAYFYELEDSQRHFERLLVKAPHNTDIRHELANVYRWRGWLDRSLSEYAQVLTVEPDLMSARVGNAHARLDYGDYATVERELHVLGEYYDDEPIVKNLLQRWRVHNRQEFVTNARFGNSSGPTFGNDQYTVDAAWYSKPLARNFRVLLFTHDAYADFPAGAVHRERAGAGLEYRRMRWLASARVSASRNGGEAGLRGTANYRLSDLWKFGAVVETQSNANPLRGQRSGVSSDLVAVNATWTHSESTDAAVQLGRQDYSDGNAGTQLLLRAQHRFINSPRFRLGASAEFYADEHDRDDVDYFSPLDSRGAYVGMRYDWLMTRRYDFALTHMLAGKLGRYDQSGFDVESTWLFDYEFQFELNNRFSGHVGFSRRRDVFDGGREYGTFVTGGIRWRF